MSRPVNFALFARQRSRLRWLPRLQRWLRDRYLHQRAWAIRLEDDMVLCRVLGQYKMYVDPQDRSISPHLMMDGYWEKGTTETLVDLARHGMVAIDVGANLGYFTLLLALLCGSRGRVLAFEPNPPIAARLRASLLLNGLQERVDLHETVLGDSDGREVNLLLSANHPGGTQVTSLAPDDGPNFLKAQTRRLDGIPGALDASLVKIDAEGMEEAIWHGMTAMVAGDRLRYLLIEFTPASYRDPSGWLDEVEAAGFTISHIDDERGICPIARNRILDGTAQRMLLFSR
jgi:FkbM family methyltransferase